MKRHLNTEVIIAAVAVLTTFFTLVGAYIKWRIDKHAIKKEFEAMELRQNSFEGDLKDHIESSDKKFDKLLAKISQDNGLIFGKIDGIKDFLITGKFTNNENTTG